MMRARWFHLALVAGAVVGAAAACNSVTGLDDFEKVDSVGSTGGSGPPDTGPDTGEDVSPDVSDASMPDVDALDGGPEADVIGEGGPDVVEDVIEDAPWDGTIEASEGGVVDPKTRWAQKPMPHEVLPDGGGAPGPKPADAASFDGYFEDYVTERTWGVSEHGYGLVRYGEAVSICAGYAGPTKYRLPTRIELVTLLEPGRNPPYNSVFDDTQREDYWTASDVFSLDPISARRWVVDFDEGFVRPKDESETAYVRCIIDK